jgi:DHA1 family bicyclomycin/chloramphenicol resistance-like MFS transporter
MTSSSFIPSTLNPPQHGVGSGLLVLLASLIGFAPLAIDMYLPALPGIATDLHASDAAVQATLAAYLAGMAGGQLFYGSLADRLGRRTPLLLGLGLFALASLGCAQAGSATELLLWRLLQALGGCAGVAMALTIVADRVQGEAATARVMSRLMGVLGLAPIIAPTLGNAVLELASWRAIFWLLTGLALLAWGAVWFTLEETLPPAQRQQPPRPWGQVLRNYGHLLAQRRFAAPALAGPLAAAGMFAYIGASAFVLIGHHGLSAGQFGAVFGVNAVLMTLASQLNALLLRRMGPARILAWVLPSLSATGLSLAALGAWAPGALWPLLIGLALYLSLLGFVSANTSALAMSGHAQQQRGSASGLMGTLQFACGAAVGSALSASGHTGPLALGLAMSACALLAWGAMACAPRSQA